MSKKVKRKGRRPKKTAGQRAKDRQDHFADGGSPSEWLGGHHVVHKNRKDKRKNRRTEKQTAIKDSQE